MLSAPTTRLIELVEPALHRLPGPHSTTDRYDHLAE